MEPGLDEHPVMEATNMPDNRTENEKAKGKLKIGALALERETLRELDAGELEQAQGGGPKTGLCSTERQCTRGCGDYTKRC